MPTKTREDKWEVYSGQHSGLEEEQVLNLRVGGGKQRGGAGGGVTTGGPGKQWGKGDRQRNLKLLF